MYECNLCNKKFTEKTNLVRHKKIHKGVAFTCARCDKTFNRKDSLKRHSKKCKKEKKEENKKKRKRRASTGSISWRREKELKQSQKRNRSNSRGELIPYPVKKKKKLTPEVDHQETGGSGMSLEEQRALIREKRKQKLRRELLLREDPVQCPEEVLQQIPGDCCECFRENWRCIRTHQWGGRASRTYTVRLDEGSDVDELIEEIYPRQQQPFKLNVAFGFMLQNEETGEVRYFYPSENNNIFKKPILVAGMQDAHKVRDKLGKDDWWEVVRQHKPSSKWKVALITNVELLVYYPSSKHYIGGSEDDDEEEEEIPSFILQNRGLDALIKDDHGVKYKKNMCYFRCLARHRGATVKALRTPTNQLAEQYLHTLSNPERFQGVLLSDLHTLDRFFTIHTYVYYLGEDGINDLIHEPQRKLTPEETATAMKVNLWKNHFSFIKSMTKYAATFSCGRCQKTFTTAEILNLHKRRSCDFSPNVVPYWLVINRGVDVMPTTEVDNFSFFRCLARHRGCRVDHLTKTSKNLAETYLQTLRNPEKFQGVSLKDLYTIDELFGSHTLVYRKEENGDVKLIHRPNKILTAEETTEALKVNLWGRDYAYIKDMMKYAPTFRCQRCDKLFSRSNNFHRHEQSCEGKVRRIYPGGIFDPPKTIFQKLADEGVIMPDELKFSRFRATYDIEVFFPSNASLPEDSEKLQWQNEHHLLSISVASNVAGYEEPRCFVVEKEGREERKRIIQLFLQYLQKIAKKAAELEGKRYADVMDAIKAQLPDLERGVEEDEDEDVGFDGESEPELEEEEEEETAEDIAFFDDDELEQEDASFYHRLDRDGFFPSEQQAPPPLPRPKNKRLLKLYFQLKSWMEELPVVGFNSGKYDLNVLQQELIPILVKGGGIENTIKKNGNNFMQMKPGHLKFIDITNFLAAGTSCEAFLKAYKCEGEKGFFPYEYVDSLDKLKETELPPIQAFDSWLKKSSISEAGYAICQRAWEEQEMTSLKDFLIWYNNLDVVPFLEALHKMCQFWKEKNIDMLKEAVSLPGLAFKFEMGILQEQNIHLSSFHSEESYQRVFDNNHRFAEVDKTRVREDKPVQNVVGYDANALYLWALCQPMPTGIYLEWYSKEESEDEFVVEKKKNHPWRLADEWLAWESWQLGQPLRTRLNDTEKQLGHKNYRLDGWDEESKTAFEFHGCFWHACRSCFWDRQNSEHPKYRGKTYAQVRRDTEDKQQYLLSLGINLRVMWECMWKRNPV